MKRTIACAAGPAAARLAAALMAAAALAGGPAYADGPAEWAAGGPAPDHAARAYPQYAQQRSASPIRFVSVATLARRLDDGARPVIIDVRSAAEYEQAHLPGALSIPLDEIESRLDEIPRMETVVLY